MKYPHDFTPPHPRTVSIVLPWPPTSLSGHNTGHYRTKAPVIKQWRLDACKSLLATGLKIDAAYKGDIPVSATFHAPDNRSDRVNYPNRIKPVWDGIADALGVNDRRFLPAFYFGENTPGGKVVIEIGGAQ